MVQITSRERQLAVVLAIVAVVWALYVFAIKPAQRRIRTLERVIPEKQGQLESLRNLSNEYTAIRDEFQGLRSRIASQDPGFALLPFLEGMIERHKLAGNVITMQQNVLQPQPDYSEVVVTIEFQDVSLRQLVDFLTAVERSEAVIQVGSLHIRTDRISEAVLDSTVGIYSPRLATATGQLARN